MFSWIKVAAIKLTDTINQALEPWVDFTRQAFPAEGKLYEKAAAFEPDFIARFFDPSTSFFQYTVPWNPGDQSLWHGIASTMFAFRNQVYSDGKMIAESVQGLAGHQPNGYLMRGKVGSVTEWSTSNDQASGHFAGLYFTGQQALCRQWATRIVDHKYAMTEPDGKVTKFGQLENGILTDPLRLTLLLGILRFGGFDAEYQKLLRKYGSLVRYPKVSLSTIPKFGTIGKSYDTHRAAIHLSILNDLDPSCRYYREGLERMLAPATREGNVWVMMLCARAGLAVNQAIIRTVMGEFGVPERLRGNVEVLNSKIQFYWEQHGVNFKTWGGELLATQPLPRWKCGSQDFYWQRNLRSVDNWKGNQTADTFHSGLDFLLCYYLGRSLGMILANE